MKTIPLLLILLAIVHTDMQAQTECDALPFIRGLHVYGGDDERSLPVVVSVDTARSAAETALPTYITIRFDVLEEYPPDLKIHFQHCDKDWNIDTDYFVRDDFFTSTRQLFYLQAPAGTRQYLWRFQNSFPSADHPFIRFQYSGNWIFDIVDNKDDKIIYASGRFVVVENRVRCGLEIRNDYWTEYSAPLNKVHHLRCHVAIPDGVFADFVRTVDFYKNHDLFHPYRVDSYDWKSNTFVEGIGMREKTFSYRNVLPGNGYRLFDFLRPQEYPSDHTVMRFGGPDFTRYMYPTDYNAYFGSGETAPPNDRDADYLCVRFELAHPLIENRDVFVAGIFNNWDPQPPDRMYRDEESGNYILYRWLFRGAYDYQYVVGIYDDEKGFVIDQDWTMLEGNAWEARNLYWVVVYYDDDQFGGVDRAAGFALSVSGR